MTTLRTRHSLADHSAEYRYRVSHATVSAMPLSEPAQKIVSTAAEKDRISDKGSDVRVDVVDPTTPISSLAAEDEDFEWREVLRGALLPFLAAHSLVSDELAGIFDTQVWLSAIAYLGIIVPLYSFSLFL